MKNSRVLSYLIISLIYVLATVIAILVYKNLELDIWLSILISDIVATIVVFIFSCIFHNASVYDPYWSVQPIVIGVLVLIEYGVTLSGVLMIVMISIWGIRLTANWAYVFKNLKHQDWRYTMLKEKTRKFYPIVNFTGIHMVPTIIVYLCTMPAVYVIIEKVAFNPMMLIGIIISLIAVILQCVSDIQMHKFKKNKGTGFIRDGLWKYSRHPNYLGEILMWWGIGITSFICLPKCFYFIIGALCNTALFLFVSIPMADKRNQKRGDFEQLKKETRMLLPIKK